MIFAIAGAVAGQLKNDTGFLCGFSIFVLQLTLQFSSFLVFSIALNLQLVIVHNFRGQKLERIYITASAVMAAILTVPPYAAGMYGWDQLEEQCWYSNPNAKTILIWQIVTQMIWTGLAAFGEIISSATVIIWMLKHDVGIIFLLMRAINTKGSIFSHVCVKNLQSLQHRVIGE
ncbi:hypothetical protein K435DRAFT_702562 [Dendrothele bispora CBS 962.96]|uniref:G-protein coupled receptors family 2 profile 2 domain-containing protein n=1 Tax=Dendrothele bispora (strain CBS 962.96) TaxID=1314807 RepID=A0A4S8KP07_DENBC|nr:hypothetical protein K435DRAFT_702562 [Dendrothele bispora CBS 962.96]